jgi:hypothetical protein
LGGDGQGAVRAPASRGGERRPAKRHGPVDGRRAPANGSAVDRRQRGAGGGHEARELVMHCGEQAEGRSGACQLDQCTSWAASQPATHPTNVLVDIV